MQPDASWIKLRNDLPDASQHALLPLLQRFGSERIEELRALHCFLGDGHTRLSCLRRRCGAALHVWGPAGVGKTSVVTSYLKELRHKCPQRFSVALGIYVIGVIGIYRYVRLNCCCREPLKTSTPLKVRHSVPSGPPSEDRHGCVGCRDVGMRWLLRTRLAVEAQSSASRVESLGAQWICRVLSEI